MGAEQYAHSRPADDDRTTFTYTVDRCMRLVSIDDTVHGFGDTPPGTRLDQAFPAKFAEVAGFYDEVWRVGHATGTYVLDGKVIEIKARRHGDLIAATATVLATIDTSTLASLQASVAHAIGVLARQAAAAPDDPATSAAAAPRLVAVPPAL